MLFPLVILSMLEADSVATPFMPRVWGSLGVCWQAWFVFYVEAWLLAAIPGAVAWFAPEAINMWHVWALLFAINVALPLYFRILGRLAWVIGRDTEPDGSEEAEPESLAAAGKG